MTEEEQQDQAAAAAQAPNEAECRANVVRCGPFVP